MWQYAALHYTLLLGIFTALLWVGVVLWFCQANGFTRQWRTQVQAWLRDRA